MVLIGYGGGVTDMRGSIGGTTFSRAGAGAYARARVKPVNPRSALQATRRAQLAYLTKYWSETCTPEQRADWRAYTAGTTWHNKLGHVIQINGLAAFLRLNAMLAIVGEAVHPAAPTAMGHAGGIGLSFAAENDTSKIQVGEPTGAFDPTNVAHFLAIFQGLPSQAGRLAIPKGFRYIGLVQGVDPGPLVFPVQLDSAYTMAEDQLITCRAMFIDENFRSSGPHWATATAAPSI